MFTGWMQDVEKELHTLLGIVTKSE
jgi:hypothetical protein